MASALPQPVQAIRSAILSLNSGAQAKTLTELVTGVQPRHPLMEPLLVPFGLIMYLGFKPHFTFLCRTLKTNGKSPLFRLLALIHNILLCSYSFWTASNVILLAYDYYKTYGYDDLYCTRGLWVSGMHYWGFLFYLSKYWEMLDTVLLIVKGRRPTFLQLYHHAMTIVCAYALQVSQSSVTFAFVGLNASVHTVMYAYYALTVAGVRLHGKSLITTMQIVQFVVGILMGLPMFWLREGRCAVLSQKVAVGAIIAHAGVLTKLFADFYRATYLGKRKGA